MECRHLSPATSPEASPDRKRRMDYKRARKILTLCNVVGLRVQAGLLTAFEDGDFGSKGLKSTDERLRSSRATIDGTNQPI